MKSKNGNLELFEIELLKGFGKKKITTVADCADNIVNNKLLIIIGYSKDIVH